MSLRDDQPRRGGKKAKPPAKRAKKKKARGASKPKADPIMKVLGMWKNRPEWKGKSSVEIARELREKALGHRGRQR